VEKRDAFTLLRIAAVQMIVINHNKTTVDLSSTTMYNRSADDNVIIAIPGCGQLLAAGGTPEQSKKMNYAQELHYTILAIAML
jgi:hypothetical protein